MAHPEIEATSIAARRAARGGDWQSVARGAARILALDRGSAEGHFLRGLSAKATGRFDLAEQSLRRTLTADNGRYDAGIELAELYVRLQRNREAVDLLRSFRGLLDTSPLYLEMAASALTRLDLHEEALPLYRRACELQPEIERFRTGLANCQAWLGEVEPARRTYEELLRRHPHHQRFHFELSRLQTATDFAHVEQMKRVLESSRLPDSKNIFICYALGKELEDLEAWDEAFSFYERAGNAVKAVADYDVETDLRLIEALEKHCNAAWVADGAGMRASRPHTPIFVVGLPRSGTTLTERILSRHSGVGSVGETFAFECMLRRECGLAGAGKLPAEAVEQAVRAEWARLSSAYLQLVDYKLGTEPFFVEKYPENCLYLGFVAKAFPDAPIVLLDRHPMDTCFALYKQSYFRFAYDLNTLGRFYLAWRGLMRHWRELLGERITVVRYEELVEEPEAVIRSLLAALGLPFEAACLSPEGHTAPVRTASSIQVRERIHRRSVGRWRHFQRQLAPLSEYLEAHGVEI